MFKKLIYFVSIVLLLGSVVQAADIQWTDLGADHLWSTPENWEPVRIPTLADEVLIDVPAAAAPNGPVIQDGIDAKAKGILTEAPGEPTLTITGGTLEVAEWIWFGDGADSFGIWDMTGGAVTVANEFELGWDGGAGTLTMTGGTISAGEAVIPTGSGASGELYLYGGTYNVTKAGGLSVKDNGMIDITEGTLVLEGDDTAKVNDLIAAGLITAYGGSGKLELDFDGRNPVKTTLTAIPEPTVAPILKLDVGNSHNAEELEEGFTSFTLAESGSDVDGITIEFGGINAGDARRRGEPAGVPFENIYRDFIFGRQSEPGVGYVSVTLSGLQANQPYLITLYSWDVGSTNTRIADWTTNGESLFSTIHDGNVDPPAAEDDYAYTGAATADANGVILMEAVPGEGTYTNQPFAFINALVLVPVPVDPGTGNLVHSWTFDDGTADDVAGDAEGVLIGDAAVVDGQLVLDGDGDWMDMPGDVIAMNTFEGLTIEIMFTSVAGGNTGYHMVTAFGEEGTGDNPGYGYKYVCITPARGNDVSRGMIQTVSMDNDPWSEETGVSDVIEHDDGLPHHMVCTVDDTELAFYIDGVLIGTAALDPPGNSIAGLGTDVAHIGKGVYGVDPLWAGSVDYLNLYNRALSEQEVRYLAGERATPVDPGTDGLVAFYALDGDANDSSGNELHGTIVGDPNFVEGQIGMALELDGVDDYVDSGNPPELVITEAISIACWVNPAQLGGEQGFAGLDAGYSFKAHGEGVRFTTPGILDHSSTNLTLEVGVWQHVAATFQPGQNEGLVFYLNGVETERTNSSAMNPGSGPFRIGNNQWNELFNGLIDEVAIYGRVLSGGEIRYLAGFRSIVETDPSLVIYYDFEGFGNNLFVLDKSGKGNDAVVVGSVSGLAGAGYSGSEACQITGDGSYLDLDGLHFPPEDIPTTAFTLAYWMKPEDTGGTQTVFSALADPHSWCHGGYVRNDQYHAHIGDADNNYIINAYEGTVEYGVWHHMALTWELVPGEYGGGAMYIDGELVAEYGNEFVEAPPGVPAANNWGSAVHGGARLGWDIDDGWQFSGLLDEFYVFKRELSQDEILEIMQGM